MLSVRQVLEWLADEWPDLVPGDVIVNLRKLHPSADEEQLFAWHTQLIRPIVTDVRSDLTNLPRWSQKVDYGRTFLLSILFPTPEYMRARYQVQYRFLLPFYYLYRQITGLKLIFQQLAGR
ncbi:MAG: hypothetical protein BMS9Abin02_1594 [Anaerolineae bacterium]|nr:MAG: hypothetical protein BMS9Abin02_1594 [Anaerolineae bacterium]